MGAFLVWTTKAGENKSLRFDVVLEESQMLTMVSTDSPVEDGPDVTDHIREELDRCSLTVFVTNHPIEDVNGRGGRMASIKLDVPKWTPPLEATPGSVFNAVGGAIKNTIGSLLGGAAPEHSANVFQFPAEFDAPAETIAALDEIRTAKQLVDVVIPSRYYSGMLLEKVTPSRDGSTGDAIKIGLEFKQIKTVQVSIVAAPIPTEIRGAVMKKKGAQGPKDSKTPARDKAFLKGLYDEYKRK